MKLKDFFVKINKDNIPSIKMFEKIGYHFYNYNRHFNENEYRITITDELSRMKNQVRTVFLGDGRTRWSEKK